MVLNSRVNRRTFAGGTAALATAASVGLRTGVSAQDDSKVTYMLWDSNQLPAYQACADKFKEDTGITVEITQLGWGDYWTTIQTGMISGTAPDVFTNHLAMFPEFAQKGQLVDIAPMVESEGMDLSIYQGRLNELWARDGKRYGLPKDWDTISLVYNKEMLDAAGVDPAELNELTWNPEDGGTFQEMLKKLTIDENGNDATSADFDGSKVKQYGLINPLADGWGQSGWSIFTNSTGWDFTDGPWTPPFHFDDERFITSIQNQADWMNVHHVAMPEEQAVGANANELFSAGVSAFLFQGSWMITWLADNLPFEWGFARLPIGPEGRKCMINGLADSIWNGSKNQEAAWQWVKYLASPEAQETVGSFGAVFPAIFSGAKKAQEAYEARGLDVSTYLDQAAEENGTFLFPIMDHASEYSNIVVPALQEVGLGTSSAADVIPDMAAEVNDLFN